MSQDLMNLIEKHQPLVVPGIRNVIAVLFIVFVFALCASAAEQTPENPPANSATESQTADSVPDIAEIVPAEVRLVGRLKDLEKKIQAGIDRDVLENDYKELEIALAELEEKLDNFKDSQEYKYNKLVDLRERLKLKSDAFEVANKPLSTSIRQLGMLRKEWLAEQARWSEWQSTLLKEGGFEQLRSIFNQATETIDTALDIILSELDAMLAMQERAGGIEQKLDTLYDDVDSQIEGERRNTLFNDAPPMYTKKYLAQIRNGSLWKEVIVAFKEIPLSDRESAAQFGWILILQAVIALVLFISIQKKRNLFEQTGRWRFLALHPLASGLFLSYLACVLIYEYQSVPNIWKLGVTIVGGVSFACLSKSLVEESWKAQFIYGLVAVIIVTKLMDVLNVPIPVIRLYICFAALAGLLFCLRLVAELKKEKRTGMFLFLLRSGVWFFGIVFVAEILGTKALATYLFVSLIRSLGTVLIFVLLMYMIRGGLEWVFDSSMLRQSTSLSARDTDSIVVKLSRFFDALIILLIIVPAILMIWGVYESIQDATMGVLGFGFNVGSNHLTVRLVMISAAILYGSFLISWTVQKMLIDELLFKHRVEKAARTSIARLVNYFIVVVGFLIAISVLGIEITKLTIMISALGVGIGFGLQGIVNNFVSGLILLFEQPIRIGDIVEIGGLWSEIKHIGVRSTIVRSFDHSDIIIPNADLISNQVTNWTLEDREARLIIGVGVAYGSDVQLVMETLAGCARDNTHVSKSHSPQALFVNFGESTLDFELRVFVPASMRLSIRSELNQEIDKRFREKDISIAFPQRDLHLPGLDMQKYQHSSLPAQEGSI